MTTYRIKDNPRACVNEKLRGERTCKECYWSQVDAKGQWTGSERCWNSQCLVVVPVRE